MHLGVWFRDQHVSTKGHRAGKDYEMYTIIPQVLPPCILTTANEVTTA